MGVPLFGNLSEALDLEEVSGERFRLLAGDLARFAEESLARVAHRDRSWDAVHAQVAGMAAYWRGPRAVELRRDFEAVAREADPFARPGRVADVFHELAQLAVTARSVGDAIDAARLDHRNRLQATAGVADEWIQRGWTNVQDLVGAESDEDAQRTREAIDQANRSREIAEARVREQLAIWRSACQGAAAAVAAMTDALEGTLRSVPGERPPSGQPGPTAPADLRRRWVESVIQPYVLAHRDDPMALAALWQRLSVDERRVLMELRPDLVDTHLAPHLSGEERRRLAGDRDAMAMRDAMRAVGLDPDRFDPNRLQHVDTGSEEYRRLLGELERIGRDVIHDPVRAAELFRHLGVDGVRTLLGLSDQGLLDAVRRGPDGEPDRARIEAIVGSYVSGFAGTTGMPELASLREALLKPETPWQLQQLAVLLSGRGDRYDPAFLLRAFDEIEARGGRLTDMLLSRPDALTRPETAEATGTEAYPYGTSAQPLYSDHELLVPALVAVRAIGGNPEASWQLVHDGDAVRRDRLDQLLHLDGAELVAEHGFWGPATGSQVVTLTDSRHMDPLHERAEAHAAAVVRNATTEYALDRHDASFTLYAEAIRSVATGDVSDHAKRAMAVALPHYLDDLAAGAWMQVPNGEAGDAEEERARATHLTRPELIAFLAELGGDDAAARQLGGAMGAWAEGVGFSYRPEQADAFQRRLEGLVLITGAVRNGFDVAEARGDAADEDFAAGVGSVSGMVIEGVLGAGTNFLKIGDNPMVGALTAWAGSEGGELIEERVKATQQSHAGEEELAQQADGRAPISSWSVYDQVVLNVENGWRASHASEPDRQAWLMWQTLWKSPPHGDRHERDVDLGWDAKPVQVDHLALPEDEEK